MTAEFIQKVIPAIGTRIGAVDFNNFTTFIFIPPRISL